MDNENNSSDATFVSVSELSDPASSAADVNNSDSDTGSVVKGCDDANDGSTVIQHITTATLLLHMAASAATIAATDTGLDESVAAAAPLAAPLAAAAAADIEDAAYAADRSDASSNEEEYLSDQASRPPMDDSAFVDPFISSSSDDLDDDDLKVEPTIFKSLPTGKHIRFGSESAGENV